MAYALFKLHNDAYTADETKYSLDMWCEKRRTSNVQFKFWNLIMTMELTILT